MQHKMYEEALLLRVHQGTTEKLRKAAGRYGQTVSEYLRQVVRKALEQDTKKPNHQ